MQTITCNLCGRFDITVDDSASDAKLIEEIKKRYKAGLKDFEPEISEITRKMDGTIVSIRID